MKFEPETTPGVNTISRHDPGRIVIGSMPFAHSLIVPWQGEVRRWHVERYEQLTADALAPLIALQPELVILGSGRRLRLAGAALMRALIERRIGFESMDTAAACRTYNVLASERRRVVAALILEPAD
ncbi:MAG TPA: Mth938-like domain-containing protein [Rubrivivax sp.]|nr:Mth938-like domain-containing protein [Burkholderiales bacterium]HNT40299.1 Mth938-like domain-containing protein [Rubrivivax sp.]